MTLIDRVLQYVTEHPLSNTARIEEDIRKPVQEIEACLSALRRQKKIVLHHSGLWIAVEDTTVSREAQPGLTTRLNGEPYAPRSNPPKEQRLKRKWRGQEGVPSGHRRCHCCKEVKPLEEFGRDYCHQCASEKQRDRDARARRRAEERAQRILAAMKRKQMPVAERLNALEEELREIRTQIGVAA